MNDNNLIVSAEWLAANTQNPQVVIVDCRFALADAELGQKQYQESHITGAFYLDLNRDLASVVGTHGGRHPLPNIAELAEKLSAIGINSSETLVVAYDDSRLAFASRLWWLLRYMGHSKVALLDGGFSAWKAAGYPVTNTLSEPREGKFVVKLQPDMAVDIEAVKERKDLPETVLVDSRESERYEGLREPIDPIAGHIPGAVNYPWQGVTDETGKVRSTSEQKQRWAELEKAEEIIVYCGSGVTACVNLLSLEIAGIPDAKLYVGSWSDWCSYQL
ncbi:MAG: sulfurtransferase [Microcoleus sp. PH2017_10_PVI_O_A]|uniref:sulfurtransferase n=1 Tax=unclassified Microcoleus TaxID=2642155 RepID=UPI001DA0F2C8|nr:MULTISPECIES: sulfurtransferase [unclassified Microcoleus]TAE82414.1 MAG: sulfurtransferase [Oscillatoriales cyanobacterium]MCC3406232.1 sulfurtransferase [Microcoleus sp. PH2017_10_PVI_O_A]MCC3460825.1 sulfurtransferase [Microcoleus sp. PH2017_11_PCY_U_A]MCC3479387.1 sulfurtransferase [Microcoleus sp. PH2017_12_PCY_D_A]MCC3529177.1 sulfurtransferase [Microcoleus sp. PH2017_21_RUC_O_A]